MAIMFGLRKPYYESHTCMEITCNNKIATSVDGLGIDLGRPSISVAGQDKSSPVCYSYQYTLLVIVPKPQFLPNVWHSFRNC